MKKIPIKIVALLAALLAIFAIFSVLTTTQNGNGTDSTITQAVVTATTTISAGDALTQGMLTVKEVPVSEVLPGAVLSMEDAVDQVANQRILPGEQIVTEKLGGIGLSYQLPEGMRAITLQVEIEGGVAGMIRPGDKVDILYSYYYGQTAAGQLTMTQVQTDYLLQNISVCAIDQIYDSDQAASLPSEWVYTSVTLEVTPEQALQIEQASAEIAANGGSLRLSLRPQLDQSVSTTASLR